MVIVGEHREDTLLGEKRRLAMRELLRGVGQRQTDPADALELPFEGFLVLRSQPCLAADCRPAGRWPPEGLPAIGAVGDLTGDGADALSPAYHDTMRRGSSPRR